MERFPDILAHLHSSSKPFTVYSGKVSIDNLNGGRAEGEAEVQMKFSPFPRLACKVKCNIMDVGGIGLQFMDRDLAIAVPGWSDAAAGRLFSTRTSGGTVDVDIELLGEWLTRPGEIRSCRFFLLCCRPLMPTDSDSHERLTLTLGEWRVTVSQRPPIDMLPLSESRGFGITHICTIERIDRAPVSTDELVNVMDFLRVSISFASGQLVGTALPVCLDGDNNVLAWTPRVSRVDPFSPHRNWSGIAISLTDFQGLLEGFWNRWSDSKWRTGISEIVEWYLLANAPRAPAHQSLVNACVAFEGLYWLMVVNDGILAERFAIQAESQLRLSLAISDVRLNIPDELQHLLTAAAAESWDCGPAAIIEIRNVIVHTTKNTVERRERVGRRAIGEAVRLARRYLELLILRAVGYTGHYTERVVQTLGPPRRVPWAREPS